MIPLFASSLRASADNRVQFARPAHRSGIELYRAQIVNHAFEPHTHEAFGLGVIEAGVERFRYRGSDHLAPSGSLVLMNPDELHTGRAETPGGWSYRMIYIDEAALEDISGEPGWCFKQAVAHDARQARQVAAALQSLWQTMGQARDALAFDSALSQLVEALRPQAQTTRPVVRHAASNFTAVIDYMRAHLDDRLTLDALARVAGLSPFHFLRMFKAQHHATPQQMLMALRLFRAKQLLGQGVPAAAVAATVGLTDQAHLTRSFSRRYGVTPALYQRQVHPS